MPYFEVLQDGFVKRPCNADLALCLLLLDVRMNTFEKIWGKLTQKMFMENKQSQKEIRLENLIIFDFANNGNV